MVLDAERYGPLAVGRGNEATRLVTLRNLGWETVIRRLKLDASIGFPWKALSRCGSFIPRANPRHLQARRRGCVEVLPFRSCLLLVDAKQTGGVRLRGCDYEVVRDVPGKDVVIRMLGQAGTTSEVALVSNGRAFRGATIDGQPMSELPTGKTVRIQFPGKPDAAPWHRRTGPPTVCALPADAEALFESSCFAGDNDPLELRSLRRSDQSKIPQVQKARQAFLDQPIIAQEGMLTEYLFDGNPGTFCNLLRSRAREPGSRHVRLDLGKATRLGHILLEPPATGALQYAAVAPTNHAEVSVDLKTWTPARLARRARHPDRMRPDATVSLSANRLRPREAGRDSRLLGGERTRPRRLAHVLVIPIPESVPGMVVALLSRCGSTRELSHRRLQRRPRPRRRLGSCPGKRSLGRPRACPILSREPFEVSVSRTDRNYGCFIPVTQDMLAKPVKSSCWALTRRISNSDRTSG